MTTRERLSCGKSCMRCWTLPKVFREKPLIAWGAVSGVCAVLTFCFLLGNNIWAHSQNTMPRTEIVERFKEHSVALQTTESQLRNEFVSKDAFTQVSRTTAELKAEQSEMRADIKDILRTMPRRGETSY